MTYAVYIGQSHYRELTAKDLDVESNSKDFRFKRGEPTLVNKDVMEKLLTNAFGRFVEVDKPTDTNSGDVKKSDDDESLDDSASITESGRESTSSGGGSGAPVSGTATSGVSTSGSGTTTQQ